MNPVGFLREVKGELEKVTFPKRAEVIRLTVVVITISLLVGGYLGGLDFLFLNLLEIIIK